MLTKSHTCNQKIIIIIIIIIITWLNDQSLYWIINQSLLSFDSSFKPILVVRDDNRMSLEQVTSILTSHYLLKIILIHILLKKIKQSGGIKISYTCSILPSLFFFNTKKFETFFF